MEVYGGVEGYFSRVSPGFQGCLMRVSRSQRVFREDSRSSRASGVV